MATPKQTIDGVLGNGWYDEWQQLERDTSDEKKRTELNEKRFSSFKSPGATDRLWWDWRRLEKVAFDYREAMDRIARGQPADKNRVGQIHDVLTLALGVVQHDNDALEAAFAAGVVAAFVAIPFAILQLRAKRLVELLEVLEKRLEQAKAERNEAWAQAAIDTAVTGITLFMPHLGLIARGGIVVGQWLLDDALGPSTSTTATVGSKTSYVVSQYGDAIAEIEKLGSKSKRIAKGAGKVTTVTGFVFDANEVMVGYRNVSTIRQIMSQARKAYDDLLAEIRKHAPALNRFERDYEKWQVSIGSVKQNARETRSTLEDEAKRTGYKLP